MFVLFSTLAFLSVVLRLDITLILLPWFSRFSVWFDVLYNSSPFCIFIVFFAECRRLPITVSLYGKTLPFETVMTTALTSCTSLYTKRLERLEREACKDKQIWLYMDKTVHIDYVLHGISDKLYRGQHDTMCHNGLVYSDGLILFYHKFPGHLAVQDSYLQFQRKVDEGMWKVDVSWLDWISISIIGWLRRSKKSSRTSTL